MYNHSVHITPHNPTASQDRRDERCDTNAGERAKRWEAQDPLRDALRLCVAARGGPRIAVRERGVRRAAPRSRGGLRRRGLGRGLPGGSGRGQGGLRRGAGGAGAPLALLLRQPVAGQHGLQQVAAVPPVIDPHLPQRRQHLALRATRLRFAGVLVSGSETPEKPGVKREYLLTTLLTRNSLFPTEKASALLYFGVSHLSSAHLRTCLVSYTTSRLMKWQLPNQHLLPLRLLWSQTASIRHLLPTNPILIQAVF